MYNESEEKEYFLENDPKVCNASVPDVLLKKYYAFMMTTTVLVGLLIFVITK